MPNQPFRAGRGFVGTGRFETLTERDFVFTPEEIEWLGAEKDKNLSPQQVQGLLQTTGGWAIYVSVLLSGEGYEETPRTLTQYLESHVWALWEPETKAMLLRLAVPAEVTPLLAERLAGQQSGQDILTRLTKQENAFLSKTEGETYRFHELFRDFLMERIEDFLGSEEIRRLNSVAAEYYYEHGNYFMSMRYFYKNRDHEGVIRCERASTLYSDQTESMSVEACCHFAGQYILHLSPDFIDENPYLIVECSYTSFLNGDTKEFTRYCDMLYQRMPDIMAYPDLVETAGFLASLDPRVPMLTYAKQLAEMMPDMRRDEGQTEARSNTITQNLPYFHRSMRDYSELYELKTEDVTLLRDTFGAIIGEDYGIMEQSLIAGILYERGELLNAARHAINGYMSIRDGAHPETVFSAHMILSAVLYAMGAAQDADSIMGRLEETIERKAPFLRPNFKAMQTARMVRDGDMGAAREWLTVYATRSERLPFYQIARHFATLRSYIALGEYVAAADFGKRLRTLADEYCRHLDQIESGLLTAIALWQDGKTKQAVKWLEQAARIAMPYGFTQQFAGEGMTILPILWEIRSKPSESAAFTEWLGKLTDEIYHRYGLKTKGEKPKLTARQKAMLSYLNQNLTHGEIAEAIGLGIDTVNTHVRLLYRRLGVHSADEAVAKAMMLGLLEG